MTAPTDNDMLVQAQPGHGIPSQDPDPAAQSLLQPQDAARGALGGAATGASASPAESAPRPPAA